MYHNSKTLLIAAAILGITLTACGVQAPTATPATPVQNVQPTVLVTAPTPTPSPVSVVIEKIVTPTALPYTTWGRLGRFESVSGEYFNSIHVLVQPGATLPAFNFVSTGARYLSIGGLQLCNGKLLGVGWGHVRSWIEPQQKVLLTITADRTAKQDESCTWIQRFILTTESEKEEVFVLITVSVIK